jgi:hypothetical protein
MLEQGLLVMIELERPAISPPGRYRGWAPSNPIKLPYPQTNADAHSREDAPPDEREIRANRREDPETAPKGPLFLIWCGFR